MNKTLALLACAALVACAPATAAMAATSAAPEAQADLPCDPPQNGLYLVCAALDLARQMVCGGCPAVADAQ